MQTLGLHLTASSNNHPCPKLRWVFGMDHMVLWESEVALSTKIHVRLHNSRNLFPSEFSEKAKYTRPHGEDEQSNNRKDTVKIGSGRDSHRERLKTPID